MRSSLQRQLFFTICRRQILHHAQRGFFTTAATVPPPKYRERREPPIAYKLLFVGLSTKTKRIDFQTASMNGNPPYNSPSASASKTFTIYKNGTQIDQWSNWDTDTGLTGLQLGSRFGGGTKLSGDETVVFDNVTIWNKALSAGEVSDIITVPEPTTATLSLLALAGLAARRRRK